MPCAVLLFFLTGLSFEIKRIIIAFWAFVKREIENFSRNFGMGRYRLPRARSALAMTPHKGSVVQARRVVQEADPYGRVIGGAVCGGTHGSRPTTVFVGQGPCAVPGVRKKTRSGRCRHRPLRKRNKRCNGRATARVAPTDALQGVRYGGPMWASAPTDGFFGNSLTPFRRRGPRCCCR